MIDDLAGDELRVRLIAAGCDPDHARWLVDHRDDPVWAAAIEALIDPETKD